ncbi:MAG: L-threonylcarbamoyladenylate synthase [Chloroflexota bacterium]|nr:L-threonylcarbamoyladenylate synthase [Dehalococcoidia bacterium]MDW8252983.1 L-threonylcarbamoyladenylate synthase [Chloroflexota bacterium]
MTGTRRVRVDPERPDDAVLADAGAVIRRGGLVAFPTETVYGLGANALDEAAVARIFAAKERALSDPVIVHLADPAEIARVAAAVPPAARLLAERFWPGPLTLVLPKQNHVPANVTAGRPTVGVRVPRHPVAQGLIRAAGVPIAAPSANRFTRTSATLAEHVLDDLEGRVDLILDAGPAPIGIESTVVAVDAASVRLLRPGAVSAEEIAAVIAPLGVELRRGALDPSEAPGLMKRHYAPRARLTVFHGPPDRAVAAALAQAAAAIAAGRRVGALFADDDAPEVPPGLLVERLGPRSDLPAIARHLFAALRRLDRAGVELIVAPTFGETGLGAAIFDRLSRAAEGRVVTV